MNPLVILVILSFIVSVHSTPISTVQTIHLIEDSDGVVIAEDIEFNLAQDVAIIRAPAEELASDTAVVIDFANSRTGVYHAEAQKCYLADDVASDSTSANELLEKLETPGESASDDISAYQVKKDAEVRDATLLPAPLQSACEGLPLLWMEPAGSSAEARQFADSWLPRTRRSAGSRSQGGRALSSRAFFDKINPFKKDTTETTTTKTVKTNSDGTKTITVTTTKKSGKAATTTTAKPADDTKIIIKGPIIGKIFG